MMYGWNWGSGMGWGFGGLLVAALVAGVVFLLIGIFRKQSGSSGLPGENETAEEILKKRYARGEISREEFLRMRKDLM